MSVGWQIAAARALKKISAKDLAVELGIAHTYLSRIENDKAPGMSYILLLRICRALKTEPNVILEWEKDGES